jgi:Integrase core domain
MNRNSAGRSRNHPEYSAPEGRPGMAGKWPADLLIFRHLIDSARICQKQPESGIPAGIPSQAIQGADKEELTLHCVTMIDPVTGWFELAEIPVKSANVVIDVLEQKWLNRYPRPTSVVMDHGREFMAEVKRTLKHDYGVQHKLITTRNPQANAMVERAHIKCYTVC